MPYNHLLQGSVTKGEILEQLFKSVKTEYTKIIDFATKTSYFHSEMKFLSSC